MKICEVVRVYPTHRWGGMPIKAKIFSEALTSLGHEVHVLTTSLQGVSKVEVINGVTVHYLDCPAMEYSDKWYEVSSKVFNKLHTKYKFDVLHSESYAGYEIQTDIPKLATVHGTGFGLVETYAIMKLLLPELMFDMYKATYDWIQEVEKYSKFEKLIAVSNKEARVLKQKYFHPKVVRVYNPVNPIFFNHNWSGDEDYFFSYGISCNEKGIHYLHQLSEKIKIVFAGNENPGGNIIYVGQLEHEKIAEHLEQCKGFINPTFYCKGFDLTTCEAMAVGTPVFATFVQVDEDLEDGKNCIFLDPKSSGAREIEAVSNNRELCKEISRNAKMFAIEHFSIKNVVSNFLKECGTGYESWNSWLSS